MSELPVERNKRTCKWYYVGWLSIQLVCELFVVGDEMGHVDVAEVLLDEHILADGISKRTH